MGHFFVFVDNDMHAVSCSEVLPCLFRDLACLHLFEEDVSDSFITQYAIRHSGCLRVGNVFCLLFFATVDNPHRSSKWHIALILPYACVCHFSIFF